MTIKKIIQQLELRKIDLEEMQEAREIKFDEKSERWQESEAGQLYLEKTEALDDAICGLEEVIDHLKSL